MGCPVGRRLGLLWLVLVSFAMAFTPTSAFIQVPSGHRRSPRSSTSPQRLLHNVVMVSGDSDEGVPTVPLPPKGFGKSKETFPPSKPSVDTNDPTQVEADLDEQLAEMNARERLAFWNRQRELEKELDLQEIKEYKETQKLISEGKLGYLPEQVSNRILRRVFPFIITPALGGVALFFFYFYLVKQLEWEIPPPVVAFTTQIPFIVGLLGITYSIMSASWEPDVEGSFWGWIEFKQNILNLLDSLQKSRREERVKAKIQKYETEEKKNRAQRREMARANKNFK